MAHRPPAGLDGSELPLSWELLGDVSQPLGGTVVTGDTLLRHLPGRRLVVAGYLVSGGQLVPGDGKARGAQIVVKAFPDTHRGRRHWQREVHGLQALEYSGLPGPGYRYLGSARLQAMDASHLLVVMPRYPGLPLGRHLAQGNPASPATAQQSLLENLLQLLGRMHRQGLGQQDPHLDNFLVAADGALRLLDAGAIGKLRGRRARERNLAALLAQLAGLMHGLDLCRLLAAYQAGYTGKKGQFPRRAVIQRQLARATRARWQHYRRKLWRDCSEFATGRSGAMHWVCRRELLAEAGDGWSALLAGPDAALASGEGEFLKRGNSATVFATGFAGRSVVLKRNNIKGPGHFVRRALRPTRAARCWRNAHWLGFYGIATARPLAVIEERLGPLRRRGYYINERIPGAVSLACLAGLAPDQRQQVVGLVAQTLARLFAAGLVHGDLKADNLQLTGLPEGQPHLWLLDLDAMASGGGAALHRRWRADLVRLLRNFADQPKVRRDLVRALSSRLPQSLLPPDAC